jgi:biopolymer transport protein ExbB/TolQ
MTKKLQPSTKALLALLFLLPAADVAAQEASGGGFMSAIAEFFEAGGPFIYVNCITLAQVQKLVMANDIERAIKLCNAAPSAALPKVVKAGLTRANRGEMEIRNAVEEATLAIVPVLQKRTPNLASIANMATLLGLLGTITGLITAFRAVGAVSPELKAKVLAQGVAEAMYTTAFGLAIAVVCMFGHLFLTNMTKKIIDEIDQYSVKLENLLISRGKGTASALDRIT